MNVISSEGIVLRQRDFKDRDRLVTFLTRDKGKLSGIAKGSKVITGRGVGAYEPFTHCVVHYVDKAAGGLVQIRKCDVLPPRLFPVTDYPRYLHMAYFTELVELSSVSPADGGALFDLLAGALEQASRSEAEALPLRRLDFELGLLGVLGWQPDWKHCVHCGRPIFQRKGEAIHPRRLEAHQFDAAAGGIRCPDCRQRAGRTLIELSPGTLSQFAAWMAARSPRDAGRAAPLAGAGGAPPSESGVGAEPRLEAAALAEMERAVTAHLLHHLERKPQSLELLESENRNPAGESALAGGSPASLGPARPASRGVHEAPLPALAASDGVWDGK
jgi:DNA repair protein RecO (recombination protein O)